MFKTSEAIVILGVLLLVETLEGGMKLCSIVLGLLSGLLSGVLSRRRSSDAREDPDPEEGFLNR